MQSEIANGESPILTSLVGASAAPNQTPATRPHVTPRRWTEAICRSALFTIVAKSFSRPSAQRNEQCDTNQEDAAGNKEVTIGEDCSMCFQSNRAPVIVLSCVIANVEVTVSSTRGDCQCGGASPRKLPEQRAGNGGSHSI